MGSMSIFKPAARYPADPRAVFILALSVFSGLTAVALGAAPDSLSALLPRWVVLVWAILLALGSATTLFGMSRQTVNGIVIEQIGSVMVAATTLFYSGIAIWQIGIDAIQGIGIIFAWGLSCGARWIQLQALINDAVGRAQKRDFLSAFEVELQERADRERKRNRDNNPLSDWRDVG